MNNPINSEDQERVLGVLHSRGWVSSEDLMAVLGKSQPTVSRVLASLSGRVLAFGNARARRYGLPAEESVRAGSHARERPAGSA